MKIHLRAGLLAAAFLSVTTVHAEAQQISQQRYETTVLPELNKENTVEVGSPMLLAMTGIMTSRPVVTLKANVSGKGNSPGTGLTLKAGPLSVEKETPKGTYYRSAAESVALTTLGMKQPDIPCGVFIPADANKPATLWWGGTFGMTDMPALGKIDVEKSVVTDVGPDAAHRELVYSGLSKGSINLLYREYSADMVRPAFTQELQYDLSAGDEIGFKGARFKILKATNVDVRYVVTKSLSQ
jgi:hypothetical protein